MRELLRNLLMEKRLPESWIPPSHVQEVRTLSRLYMALMDQRRAWLQRIHAQLFHQGVPRVAGLLTADGKRAVAEAELSCAGRQVVDSALTSIGALEAEILPLRAQLQRIGSAQPAVRALMGHYGVGLVCGTIIWAELGDCRRFHNSDQVIRFAGLDITVWSSDSKRSAGRLSRQGSPELRRALFEAAKCAARPASPDYAYYAATRTRLNSTQATLAVARKLARRCYHTLDELGDEPWLPQPETFTQNAA